MNTLKLIAPLCAVLVYAPSQGWAIPVLGTELSSFAVLGGSQVTNTGATTLTGNLGVFPGASITGKETITINGTSAAILGNPFVHEADAFANLAQTQLVNAMTSLGLMGPGLNLGVDLAGLTLTPGIYTVTAGTSNLTGALTLDGLGNANASWVFQMPTTLITSSGSVVNVINTGAGAGIYWNVGSSATLGTTTSFEGNILASTNISMTNGVTLGCGRALAHTGAVTMIADTISIGCLGTGEEGSLGLSGGLEVLGAAGTIATALPFAPLQAAIPEPETYALMLAGLGFVGFVTRRNKRRSLNA